jgi:uncharacterized protein (DUF4415 family)
MPLKPKPSSRPASRKTPTTPKWTAEDFARARPAAEVAPDLVAAWRCARKPQKKPTKELVSPRIERKVLERLRATGPGWQTRVNDMLRAAVLNT